MGVWQLLQYSTLFFPQSRRDSWRKFRNNCKSTHDRSKNFLISVKHNTVKKVALFRGRFQSFSAPTYDYDTFLLSPEAWYQFLEGIAWCKSNCLPSWRLEMWYYGVTGWWISAAFCLCLLDLKHQIVPSACWPEDYLKLVIMVLTCIPL